MNEWQASVAVWLVMGVVGTGMACYGLTTAIRDDAAIEASGRNGLLLHLSRAAVRSWAARVASQAALVVFALLAASLPAPVLPEGAGAAAVARLTALRWALSLVFIMHTALSLVDIRARLTTRRIVDGGG